MNLDAAVQVLADRIGRPIIVFDANFSVAAFSVHEGEVDHARLTMILSRKSSARAIQRIRNHHVDRAAGAVLLPVYENTPLRVVAPLRHEGALTGYASYMPEPGEDPDSRDTPPIVATRDEIGTILAARAPPSVRMLGSRPFWQPRCSRGNLPHKKQQPKSSSVRAISAPQSTTRCWWCRLRTARRKRRRWRR